VLEFVKVRVFLSKKKRAPGDRSSLWERKGGEQTRVDGDFDLPGERGGEGEKKKGNYSHRKCRSPGGKKRVWGGGGENSGIRSGKSGRREKKIMQSSNASKKKQNRDSLPEFRNRRKGLRREFLPISMEKEKGGPQGKLSAEPWTEKKRGERPA